MNKMIIDNSEKLKYEKTYTVIKISMKNLIVKVQSTTYRLQLNDMYTEKNRSIESRVE